MTYLLIIGNGFVNLTGVVIQTGDGQVDGVVGYVAAQLLQFVNRAAEVYLAVNDGILTIGLWVLRVEIDGLVVHRGSTTTVVGQCTEIAFQNVGGCIALVGLECHVCIFRCIGSVLGFHEGATKGYEVLGVLLVLFVERL